MDNIYKVLSEMMGDDDGLSDDVKKGILVGIELMGYQAEKWLDNEEHAISFRNNTKLGDGWSGWKETYDHVAGFMYSEQPDEEQMKNCKLETYVSDDEELEEGEVEEDEVEESPIDEWTTWLKSDGYKKSDNFPYTNDHATDGGPQNPLKSAEEMKESIMIEKNDSEDMELSEEEEEQFEDEDGVTVVSFTTDDEYYGSADEEYGYGTYEGSELDDWQGFREITYENVKYLLKEDDNTVNPYDGPFVDGGVGVMKKEEKVIHTPLHKTKRDFTVIEFNSHDEFEDHMSRVRESILPQDGEEVKDILVDFILKNYSNFRYCKGRNWVEFRGKKNGDYHKGFCIEGDENGLNKYTGVLTTLPSLRDYSEYQIKTYCVEELPLEDLNEQLGWTQPFPPNQTGSRQQGDRFFMYGPKGKKMGDVMKEIEKVYTA